VVGVLASTPTKLKIDSSEFPRAIVPPLIAPKLTLRVDADDVLRSSTIVPGARSVPPLVQVRLPSPELNAPPAPIGWPFHSLSLKWMTVPVGIPSMATNAKPSLPSALKPTNAIDPGPSAMFLSPSPEGAQQA